MHICFPSRALAVFLSGILVVSATGTLPAQTLTWGAGGAGGSGQWDAGTTVDWYNGSANVPWTNGDSAVFAGTAGTVSLSGLVTASQVTFSTAGYTLTGSFLEGTSTGLTMETDADTTFTGTIFGNAGSNTPFTKTGSGALIINTFGDLTFFSSVNIASGEMRYTNYQGPDFTGNYVLGNAASAALTFSTNFSQVGSLGGGGTTGGVVRPNATTGSFTLQIYGTVNASYAGTLAGNGNATLSLQKNGTTTQTLTNASPSLTGSTTVNGGTLALSGTSGALPATSGVIVNMGGTFGLDNSTAVNTARLGASTPITLNGGTLGFVGNATQGVNQSFGALNIASGASTISVTAAGSGTTQLTTSGLVRTPGATTSFSGGGHVTLTGATNTNGILGGYATVGADWAAVDASGNVSAFVGYTTDATTASSTDNLRVTTGGGTTSLASVQTRNSLNLVNTGSAAATVDLGANGSLTLTSGGLLTSGTGGFVIQNGKLGSGNGELVITNQAALTISSPVKRQRVDKIRLGNACALQPEHLHGHHHDQPGYGAGRGGRQPRHRYDRRAQRRHAPGHGRIHLGQVAPGQRRHHRHGQQHRGVHRQDEHGIVHEGRRGPPVADGAGRVHRRQRRNPAIDESHRHHDLVHHAEQCPPGSRHQRPTKRDEPRRDQRCHLAGSARAGGDAAHRVALRVRSDRRR